MRTKDLGLIAVMYTFDIMPELIETEGKVVWFTFPDSERTQYLEANYFDGLLEVRAMSYANSLKQVRTIIFKHL